MNKLARLSVLLFPLLAACYPTPGPDKTVAGAILGGGWGTGAGAVVGNQVGHVGPGMAIGAGIGAASGIMTGANLDAAEGEELEQERQMAALKVQVGQNQRALMALQDSLDDRTRRINSMTTSEQVFFDSERANLHMGSAAALERLANAMKNNPFIAVIEIHGHADDLQTPTDNLKLSEARAKSVASFLSNQGISLSQMRVFAHGNTELAVSGQTEPGRQLNRRVEVLARP